MDGQEEIRLFQDAVRARIEHSAADTGRGIGEIPAPMLLALVCASGFSAVLGSAGIAGLRAFSPAGAVLAAVISGAPESPRARRHGQASTAADLEEEIFWRIERVLAAGNEQAAALRAEIAAALERTDVLRGALLAAIETGNDQLRGDIVAAIGILSSGFAEMGFLLRTGDHGAAEVQRRLDGQSAQFQALSEIARRQAADVRMAREDLAAIRHRQARAGHPGKVTGPGPQWAGGCPYLGLLPFDQAQAVVFCGRQRLTAELMVMLAGRMAGPAMIVVSGASGAGKSSLLRAGLLPALAAGLQLEGSDRWPRAVMTPGSDPLAELAARLAALGGDAAAIRRTLAADPDQAHLVAGQAAGRAGRLVIVVDQFEEVFTLASGGQAGQQFIAALCAAATRPCGPGGEPPALVVLAVRGDFWARCAAHAGLARVMRDGLFVVGPMTGGELRQAITGPAATAGLQIDANLAEVILSDLRSADHDEAEGVLPLLSQAMMLTWGRREGDRLTVRGYNQTGGVARCVEFGAETIYEALPDAGQQVAREIFQALVLVSPDGQLARRPVRRAALCPDRRGPARRAVDNVLEAFASGRLLVLDGDTVQIAHDVLLRAWPRLRGWLESDQASWILYTQLQEDAAQWAGHQRDTSFLYRGSQLAAVQQAAARWAADPGRYPGLTGDQSGFLAAGRQHAARGTRIRRGAVLTLALLLIVSVAGFAVATKADRTASQQRDAAISNQLAAQSEALDGTNAAAAASLAAAAWKVAPTAEARTSMLDVLAQPQRGSVTAASGNITAMTFSPDGKRFATATDKGATQIWDTATHREVGKPLIIKPGITAGIASIFFNKDDTAITVFGRLNQPSTFYNISTRQAIGPSFVIADDPFIAAIFSPDGKIIATWGANTSSGIIDVATHRQIGPLLDGAQPLAFSPDGKLLAVAGIAPGGPRGTELLDITTRTLVGPVIPSSGSHGTGAAFSPDGKVVAVPSGHSIAFWDIARGQTIGTAIPVIPDDMAFSPDGKILAAMSGNGESTNTAQTVSLWDTATHQQLGGPLTADANVSALAFSPDSTILATANGSRVSFWDPAVSRQIGPILNGATGPIAFSRDGQILAATTIGSHGAGLWDMTTHREAGDPIMIGSARGARLEAVALSPDGKILAVAGRTNTGTQLWDTATGRRIGTVRVPGDSDIAGLAFSPDGKYLAIGATGSHIWLWDMKNHRTAGRPMPNADVGPLAFSPDGRILAYTNGVSTVLFSVATRSRIGVLRPGGLGSDQDMAFSPDGSMIATAGDFGVILWKVASRHRIGVPLDVGTGPIQALAFSPDGTLLAAGGEDSAVRLWDVASREQVGSPLVVTHDTILGLAFSPDGTVLAAASDRATRIWGAGLNKDVLKRVCAIGGGSMTTSAWNSYVKSAPYRQTCT